MIPSSKAKTSDRALWLVLVLISGLPRLLGAFLLPNAFGDAYVYIRDIGAMSEKLSAGTFAITDLYGFWLPFYQGISAVINVFVGNGFYVGKFVSAIFGVGTCLFVYGITFRLTAHRLAALLAFLLIALNPLHIFYSASAMTDVPHAFFVLGSLHFLLRRGWIMAALFAALAGLTRMESWMFIGLIPALQFLRERRVSLIPLAILTIPPLFWLSLSWKATGDWLACFRARQQYHDLLLGANPTLVHFSLPHLLRDGPMLLFSTDLAVMAACFLAASSVIHTFAKAPSTVRKSYFDLIPALVFFFAFLSLIVLAYLTGTQPIIFPRYGLILFSLGIPILAWTVLMLRKRNPQIRRRLLIAVIAICVFDANVQLVGSIGLLNQISAQRAVADYLHARFEPASNAHIYCDEGTVMAMSGIPPEKFLTSADAPRDPESFIAYLREQNVEYLVFVSKEDSTLLKLFPGLEHSDHSELFEPVINSQTKFLPTSIWLYRVRRGSEGARQPGQ